MPAYLTFSHLYYPGYKAPEDVFDIDMLIKANAHEGITKVLGERFQHSVTVKGTTVLEDTQRIIKELSQDAEMFKGEWSVFSYSLGYSYVYTPSGYVGTPRGDCVWLGFDNSADATKYRLMTAVDQ